MTRSPFGGALLELVLELTDIQADPELDPDARAIRVFGTYVATPFVWPMDDVLYEITLAWAGINLSDPEDLERAALITACLAGTGEASLSCSHEEPSALCERLRQPDMAESLEHGRDLLLAGRLDPLLNIRADNERRLLGSRRHEPPAAAA